MSIQRLKPVSGGTDFSKYFPFNKVATTVNVPSATEYTLLDVTGEGFFDWASFYAGSAGGNYNFYIYLDGVIAYQLLASNPNTNANYGLSAREFLQESYNGSSFRTLFPNGSSFYSPNTQKNYESIPISEVPNAYDPTYGIIESSIPFKSSIKITSSHNVASTQQVIYSLGYKLKV